MPRNSAVFVPSLLVALVATGCSSEPSSTENSDDALAVDEVVAETIPLSTNGDSAPSLQPELTHAARWKAFMVAKTSDVTHPFPIMSAYDATGRELYEAALTSDARGEPQIQLRDPDGRPLAFVNDDGRPVVKVGALSVDVRSVLVDWVLLASPSPSSPAPASAVHTSSIMGIAPGDTCAQQVGYALLHAASVLLAATGAGVTCTLGEVLTLGAGTVACVGTAVMTGYTLKEIPATKRGVIAKCAPPSSAAAAPAAKGGADAWCAGAFLWKANATAPYRCEAGCVATATTASCR